MKHPINTKEGRHERAVATFIAGERGGVPVAQTISFLKKKGLTDDEITSALNDAADGELVDSALG